MDTEQTRIVMGQAQAEVPSEANGRRQPSDGADPPADAGRPPRKIRPWRRGSWAWILACLGGGSLLIAVSLAWGYREFGSLANTLAYLNGERLLVDPGSLSFGTARRDEERDLHLMIRNRTGKTVTILGGRTTCACMTTEKFPFSITNGSQRELTIHVWLTGKDPVFERRIDFYTDDEANPVIAVSIRGEITD